MELARFVPTELLFKDVNFEMSGKTILQNVSGVVTGGEMVAIMGPSGSGKSTLLNTLAGRYQVTSGEVTLNGEKIDSKARRKIAYVLQKDIFFANLTVWDTLYFTAMVKLPKLMRKSVKIDRIKELADLLQISNCLKTVIGTGVGPGLSGGERKRVNIACELMNNPDVMLLDEPTSGLDASTAGNLISALNMFAKKSNKTIALTIHQPSSKVFYMFSNLLLLLNGHVAYFGQTEKVLDFFSSLGFSCIANYNPADFILEQMKRSKEDEDKIIQAAYERRLTSEWPHILQRDENANHATALSDNQGPNRDSTRVKNEEQARRYTVEMRQTEQDVRTLMGFVAKGIGGQNFRTPAFLDKWPTSMWNEFRMLVWRNFKHARKRIFNPFAMVQHVFITVFVSALWFQIDRDIDNYRDRMGLLFFINIYWMYVPAFDSINSFPFEREVVQKERASGTYRLSSYFLAKSFSELPLLVSLPFLGFTVAYWAAGYKGVTEYFISSAIVILSSLNFAGFGQLIGFMNVDHKVANTTATTVLFYGILFCGYYNQNTPHWLKWASYLSVLMYPYSSLVLLEFSDFPDVNCANVTSPKFTLCQHNHTDVFTKDEFFQAVGIRMPLYFYIVLIVCQLGFFRIAGYMAFKLRNKPH